MLLGTCTYGYHETLFGDSCVRSHAEYLVKSVKSVENVESVESVKSVARRLLVRPLTSTPPLPAITRHYPLPNPPPPSHRPVHRHTKSHGLPTTP